MRVSHAFMHVSHAYFDFIAMVINKQQAVSPALQQLNKDELLSLVSEQLDRMNNLKVGTSIFSNQIANLVICFYSLLRRSTITIHVKDAVSCYYLAIAIAMLEISYIYYYFVDELKHLSNSITWLTSHQYHVVTEYIVSKVCAKNIKVFATVTACI